MPQLIIAVAAAAAYAGASAAAGLVIGGSILGSTALASFAIAAVGAVVAGAVSFAGASILGLNRAPKSQAPAAQAQADRAQMVRSSIAPRQIVYGRTRVSGPIVYASSSGDQREYLHLVIPLAAHAVAGLDAVWIGDYRIDAAELDGDGNATASYLTASGERLVRARFWDGTQTIADGALVAESTDGWSTSHVGNGVAYLYLRIKYDAGYFPQGLQNISAEIRGHAGVYDPRSGATGYSANPALCVLHYLRSADGLACSDSEIDFDSFAAAANICDEAVQYDAAGNTQARFELGGALTLDRAPIDIVDDLLATCGGNLVYIQGQYRLHVAAYDTPTDTLTVSDLAGPIEVATRDPRRERFNTVRGTYVSEANGWQPADFPVVLDTTMVAEDGESIVREIDLPLVTDPFRAQRLGMLALRRARESLTARVAVRYAGLRFACWQTLSVTIAALGWSAKAFRITALSFDPVSGLVTLTLREESADSYTWTHTQASEPGPTPNTNLVSPFAIPAPSISVINEELYATRDGAGVRNRAILRWLPPAHPFVVGYDAELLPEGETDWRAVGASGSETAAAFDDVPEGQHQFRLRARSTVAASAWTVATARIGGVAAEPPSAVTGLAIQTAGGFAYLRWDLHPDLDVRAGGRIEIRHTPDTVSPTWVGSTGIGEAAPGGATWTLLPLKPGTYLAKAVDAGGRYSSTAASVSTAQATALAWTGLSTLTEHTGFSGTKTDTVVASSTLRLASGGDIDSEPDFDAIADIDLLGGVVREGSYTFATGMDLTTVKRVRITSRLVATTVNTLDQIDSRSEPIDTWLDFEGAVGGEADAWVEVRQTDDNPAGSPTWSAWRRVDASEFQARAFEFRAQLRSYDRAFNIHVSELSVTAEEIA